jgi:hypothetical protein
MVGDEGRSRKPRVTLEGKDNLECNSRGDEGFIAGKAARGRDTRSDGTPRGLDSDEMSLLYENRCRLSSNAIAPITG